jgi:hypothetical protein
MTAAWGAKDMSEKTWPPELDVLDQLEGGPLSVSVIRKVFGDSDRFVRAVQAMLDAREIQLVDVDGTEVPKWKWREVLDASPDADHKYMFVLTDLGAKRIR